MDRYTSHFDGLSFDVPSVTRITCPYVMRAQVRRAHAEWALPAMFRLPRTLSFGEISAVHNYYRDEAAPPP